MKEVPFEDSFGSPSAFVNAVPFANYSIFDKILVRCMERSLQRQEQGKFTNVAVAISDNGRIKKEELPAINERLRQLAQDIYGDVGLVFKVRLNRTKLNLWLTKEKESRPPRRKRNESELPLGMPEHIFEAIKGMCEFETILIHQGSVLHGLASIKTSLPKHIAFKVRTWIDGEYIAIHRPPANLEAASFGWDFRVVRAQ